MESLLNLDDLSLNNEKLKAHTNTLKHTLRNQFRTIWEEINEKYNEEFALTPKL